MEVELGLAFLTAHREHDHAVSEGLDGLLLAGFLDARLEVAHVPSDLQRLRVEMHGDLGVVLHLRNQVGQVTGYVRTFQRVADVPQLPAKNGFLFAQVHGKALVAERQRGGHAGKAATEHQLGQVQRAMPRHHLGGCVVALT